MFVSNSSKYVVFTPDHNRLDICFTGRGSEKGGQSQWPSRSPGFYEFDFICEVMWKNIDTKYYDELQIGNP